MSIDEERKAKLYSELELLQKPVWNWRDIAEFVGCASAKANEIRKRAIDAGGKVDFNPHGVQSRHVLKLMNTTPEIEIQKRRIELTGSADPQESDQ